MVVFFDASATDLIVSAITETPEAELETLRTISLVTVACSSTALAMVFKISSIFAMMSEISLIDA